MKRELKEIKDPELAAGPLCSVKAQCKAYFTKFSFFKAGICSSSYLRPTGISHMGHSGNTHLVLHGAHTHHSVPSSRLAFPQLLSQQSHKHQTMHLLLEYLLNKPILTYYVKFVCVGGELCFESKT